MSGPSSRQPRHEFLALDAMRGIAAISVVFFHYGIDLHSQLMPNAPLAVDFFFVLSGFVVAHAYEKRLLAGWSLRSFAVHRLIRLWPLYLFALALPVAAMVFEVALGMPHQPRSRVL